MFSFSQILKGRSRFITKLRRNNQDQKPTPQETKPRVLLWLSLVLLTGVTSCMDHSGKGFIPSGDYQKYHQRKVNVVRVVDGDTIIVDVPDGKKEITRIRFWGMDTPETAKPRFKKKSQWLANQAMALVQKLCKHQKVTLILEKHDQRGKYGRLLAYIQLEDGRILNEVLLEKGLAKYEGRFGHSHQWQYQQIYLQAKAKGIGLWNRQARKKYLANRRAQRKKSPQ